MATGVILKVLAHIPWGQVIDNAPKLAEGATKLWQSVGGMRNKKAPVPADPPAPAAEFNASLGLTEGAALRAQLQVLEADVRSLHEQMQASTELIKALAEQNTQLVQRVELHRKRLRQLSWAAAIAFFGLLMLLAYVARG